jgi:hypothetical protein
MLRIRYNFEKDGKTSPQRNTQFRPAERRPIGFGTSSKPNRNIAARHFLQKRQKAPNARFDPPAQLEGRGALEKFA